MREGRAAHAACARAGPAAVVTSPRLPAPLPIPVTPAPAGPGRTRGQSAPRAPGARIRMRRRQRPARAAGGFVPRRWRPLAGGQRTPAPSRILFRTIGGGLAGGGLSARRESGFSVPLPPPLMHFTSFTSTSIASRVRTLTAHKQAISLLMRNQPVYAISLLMRNQPVYAIGLFICDQPVYAISLFMPL